MNIFPLSFILNFFREHKITRKNQCVMWFSGLRGAVAFALSLHLELSAEKRYVLVTATLIIVLFTIMCLGGATMPLLKVSFFSLGEREEEGILAKYKMFCIYTFLDFLNCMHLYVVHPCMCVWCVHVCVVCGVYMCDVSLLCVCVVCGVYMCDVSLLCVCVVCGVYMCDVSLLCVCVVCGVYMCDVSLLCVCVVCGVYMCDVSLLCVCVVCGVYMCDVSLLCVCVVCGVYMCDVSLLCVCVVCGVYMCDVSLLCVCVVCTCVM